MKTLQMTTKAKANAMQVESLFTPVNGRTLTKMRYDQGKYQNSGIGRETLTSDDVYAIWTERQTDSDGAYYAAYCLTS